VLESNHRRRGVSSTYKKEYETGITWRSVSEALLRMDRRAGSRSTSRAGIPLQPAETAEHLELHQHPNNEALIKQDDASCGLKAYEARKENRSGIYSYENRPQTLPAEYEKKLRKNPAAWKTFQARPPGYRRTLTWWVVSAKKEETRLKRLDQLIEVSARGRTIPLMKSKK
jgi:hypothetical protein